MRTNRILGSIIVAAAAAWTGSVFAASTGIPPKPIQGPAPLVQPKTLPATPQAAPRPATGTAAPKTIRAVQTLTATGGRQDKAVPADTNSGGTGGGGTTPGTPVPMKTINVLTPLSATGPK